MNRFAFKHLWASGLLLLGLLSCDKAPESATDPLPFPMDANKDLTVSPGDDFWQYCNGTWLAAQPPVASGAIGGMYDADLEMDRRVETLRREVPTLGRFFDMMEKMYDNGKASQAYIDAKKAEIKRPESQEEAFRAMGAMIMEGVFPLGGGLRLVQRDGKFVGMLMPPIDLAIPPLPEPERLVPLSSLQTKAGASVFSWIAEGMGVSLDNLYGDESWSALFDVFLVKSLDELYAMMLDAWDAFGIYVSPEGLAAVNAKNKIKRTEQDVKDEARLLINYPLSYELARKYIPESDKQHFVEIVESIRRGLRNRIMRVDWMSSTTKNNALAKLDKMNMFVSYPDQWYQEGLPDISGCGSFVEMARVLQASQEKTKAKLLGTDDTFNVTLLGSIIGSDGRSYPSDLTLVNAFYSPTNNCIVMFPSMAMAPILKTGVSEAREYATFAIIGHEMTHGFDSNGALYDPEGRQINWWTVADKMSFEEKQDNLVNCYNHLEYASPDGRILNGDGIRTLGENIADLGGFLTVLDVYRDHLHEQGFFGAVYQSQLRKFFESYADVWCVKYGLDKIENFIKKDEHSPASLRVNGVVMNCDLWYDLYGVTRDNKLYLPEERRSYIW